MRRLKKTLNKNKLIKTAHLQLLIESAKHDELLRFVSKQGDIYMPAKEHPEELLDMRGPVGKCYDTTLLAAWRLGKQGYKYAEGVVYVPHDEETGQVYAHAFLVKDGVAYDLTQIKIENDRPVFDFGQYYIGIEIDTMLVMDFVRSTGYSGFFLNVWRNVKLAQNIAKISGFEISEIFLMPPKKLKEIYGANL